MNNKGAVYCVYKLCSTRTQVAGLTLEIPVAKCAHFVRGIKGNLW